MSWVSYFLTVTANAHLLYQQLLPNPKLLPVKTILIYKNFFSSPYFIYLAFSFDGTFGPVLLLTGW